MIKLRRNNQAFTFISILIAIAIIFILTGQYFKKDKTSQTSVYQYSVERSKRVSCVANRSVLEGYVQAWQVSHPGEEVTFEKLRTARYNVPRCPEGGKYTIEPDGTVSCSIHGK